MEQVEIVDNKYKNRKEKLPVQNEKNMKNQGKNSEQILDE
jgi:hypothetical protein